MKYFKRQSWKLWKTRVWQIWRNADRQNKRQSTDRESYTDADRHTDVWEFERGGLGGGGLMLSKNVNIVWSEAWVQSGTLLFNLLSAGDPFLVQEVRMAYTYTHRPMASESDCSPAPRSITPSWTHSTVPDVHCLAVFEVMKWIWLACEARLGCLFIFHFLFNLNYFCPVERM